MVGAPPTTEVPAYRNVKVKEGRKESERRKEGRKARRW